LANDTFRFVGFAFATADFLFEIDDQGVIAFAAGAGLQLTGSDNTALIGKAWVDLFDPADQTVATAVLDGLVDGQRRGPIELQMAKHGDGAPRLAGLSLFRLPQKPPRTSCALTLSADRPKRRKGSGGLQSRSEFEAITRNLMETARNGGIELELGLVEFAGLLDQRRSLSAEDAAVLDQRLAGALRAEALEDAATELGDQRYAVLRRKGEPADAMARRLSRVLGASMEPKAHAVGVDLNESPGRLMRALRFSLDSFLADGDAPAAASLSDVLGQSVQRTVSQAGAFGAVVRERRFKLVFQPVVHLTDGSLHHHEALIRFDGDQSPFAMIRMAEELDIIEDLDCAVAEETVKRLRADRTGTSRLAFNASGRSITSPNFIQAIERLTKPGGLTDRLIVEVTETAAIDDLALARRHIEALQAQGLQVCLDDFGSGAASFAYLQQLPIDVVKIDGSYVRELTSSGRDDAMIRHLVSLCRELDVLTVAEMVETQAVEDMLRRAGVDYAQGWLYGQPTSEPLAPTKSPAQPGERTTPARPAVTPAARRRGAVEQWG
jgi:EAL domain-containing protein (putative c-di-GMP-specific phosphodiesterase class I)